MLSLAGFCLLFLGIFASQASAEEEDDRGPYDLSSYTNSTDYVTVDVEIDWYYIGDYVGYSEPITLTINGDTIASLSYLVDGAYAIAYDNGLGIYSFWVPVPDRTSSTTIVMTGDDGFFCAFYQFGITAYHSGKYVSLSRNAISIGQVRVGGHKADTLNVSSTGTDPITVSSSMKTGTLFSRYPTSSNRSIADGSTELDSAIFTPTARGNFSDTLIFTSNSDEVSEQRMAVYVSGQGVQAIFYSTNGNTLAFGNLRVGRTGQQTFSFSNTGDDTLFLQTPTLSGSGFAIVSGPASLILPPSQTGSVVVQFAPTQWRSYSEALRFTASNGVSAPTITLTGAGILPQVQVSNLLAFGQLRVGQMLQRTVTFNNTGNDLLHLSNATLVQPSTRFTLGAYDQTVLPGATGTFQISYAPNQRNFDTAQLLFTTDDPAHLADTIRINGQGVQAIFHSTNGTSLAFGAAHVDRTLQQTFAFSNWGDDTLFLQPPTISGSGFIMVSSPASLILPPNATGSVVVGFAPMQERSYSGILSFIASNGIAAPTVTLIGTGALPHMVVANNHETVDLGQVKVNASATRDFTVANNGGWELNLSSAAATPMPLSIKSWPSTAIAANMSGDVAVTFAPTATGPFTGTLVIAGDDSANPSDTIFLTGTGIESALSIDPVNVDFGAVPVASTVRDTIQLSNAGTASVTINSYKLASQAGAFVVLDSSARQISAGGRAFVIVSFRPDAAGSYSGTLTLATDDAGALTRTVNLSGAGVKGTLVVETSSTDFGNVAVGHDSTIRTSLKNTGQASLTIHSLRMTGSTFSHGAFTTPLTIRAGDSAFVDLTFTPAIAGNTTGSASFALGDNTLVSIALTGDGVSAAGVTETRANGHEFSLSISPSPANRIATAHISMMNAADGQLSVFDVTGHEVLSIPLGLLSEGAHNISVPVENLASGSYFVRISNANGNAAAARLILAR